MKQEVFNAIPEKDRWNCVLEGIMCYASVHKPNMTKAKKFNAAPEFSVTLLVDKENEQKAKDFGLKIHAANEFIPGPHVKIVKKVRENKTADEVKPDVVDALQNPIPSNVLIGNKSRGLVKFGRTWHPNNGGGISTHLTKVQVLDLVPFVPDLTDRDLVKSSEGYVYSNGDTTTEEFDA